ncbi:MAG: DUF732 domain-containing protein [Actinobacteria bacterium]|nr:DUF732 domain-containing protein [Actinomycetota bacterium]
MRKTTRFIAVLVALNFSLIGLTGCSQTKKAVPQPMGTAAFYGSLSATDLAALKYMKPSAVVHLGELVCTSLENKRSVMWIIKNIVTLNGPDTGIGLSPKERSRFAMGVIASAVAHLCPEQKEYVLSPHK